jgi:hypothetical protein
MILKNKSVRIHANTYGDIFISIDKVNKDGVREHEGTYKFDGWIDGVDLEVGIPKGKRKEYAKIIKLN